MSEQTSIRQAIEKLVNENKENKIDLTEFYLTKVDDDLAKILSKHQGDLVYNQDFLYDTSDSAVECLSKIKGKLYFGSISEINETQAKIFAKHNGGGLYISTHHLDPDHYDWSYPFQPSNQVLQILSEYKGELGLGMRALTSPTQAEILLNHSGGLVLLDYIILSKDVINILKKYSFKINDLSPDKFVHSEFICSSILDVKIMEEFLVYGVGEANEYQIPISLYTEITDDAATLLSEQDEGNIINASFEQGPIWLAENIVISDKAKKILSQWDGHINDLAAKEWVESLKD